MTMILTIVAATDFSPGSHAAVERAVQLAEAHGASLRLLHAFDVSAWHSLKSIFDAHRLIMDPPPDVRMQQRLTDLAESLATQTGIEVEARFSVGDPESAINAYATAHEPSHVVIGSRAEPGVLGLGSDALKVLRSPACPILIVRSTESRSYVKVLSAVDMLDVSMRAAFAAITLLPAARHHLLFAVDPVLTRALRKGDVTKEQTRVLHDSMHTETVRQLDRLAQELTKAAVYPVAGFFLGSMAQHVLHHTLRDVLVVP